MPLTTLPEPMPYPGESIKMGGVFDIVNGPGECFVKNCGCDQFHLQFHNKVVGQGLRHIANACYNSNIGNASHLGGFIHPTVTNLIRVGTGTGATSDATTALVAEVATAASSGSVVLTNPAGGTYRITIINTWNAGVLAAVAVTEIGIKSNMMATLNSASITAGTALFSRLSTTDTEFTGFTVNTAVPLQITYRFDIVFA